MIIADSINKSFKGKNVINSLSFHIPKGEIVGFIGANGAGKTTTMRMLTGALMPDSGLVRVGNVNPLKNKKENLRNIGVVNNINSSLWKNMKLKDSFDFSRYMYNINKKDFENNMKYLCEKLNLNEILNKPVASLSLGQRMRGEIAYSLLHNPEVLYLDEPTIGLDIENREKVINIIKEINKERKTTILFASNNLTDIEKTCKRIIVIHKGNKLYDGDLYRVKRKYASEYLLNIKIKEGVIPDFQDLPINKYKIENNNLSIYYENNIINSSMIIEHVIRQCFIKDIKIIEPRLEDIIRGLYEG